jgi:hypothetical protein
MTFAFGHLATVFEPDKILNRSQMTCARPSRLPFEPKIPFGKEDPYGNLDDLRPAILPLYQA